MSKYITPEQYAIAEKNGIGADTLNYRVRRSNWDIQRAVTEPLKGYNLIGKKWIELAKQNGICYSTLNKRINYGWPLERAATEPIHEIHKGKNRMKELAGVII